MAGPGGALWRRRRRCPAVVRRSGSDTVSASAIGRSRFAARPEFLLELLGQRFAGREFDSGFACSGPQTGLEPWRAFRSLLLAAAQFVDQSRLTFRSSSVGVSRRTRDEFLELALALSVRSWQQADLKLSNSVRVLGSFRTVAGSPSSRSCSTLARLSAARRCFGRSVWILC